MDIKEIRAREENLRKMNETFFTSMHELPKDR
jgi:hypothetical protein